MAIDEKGPLIRPFSTMYLNILPKFIAIPALNAKRLVLNSPLTFALPPGALALNSFINASTFGLIFRRSWGIFMIFLLRLFCR